MVHTATWYRSSRDLSRGWRVPAAAALRTVAALVVAGLVVTLVVFARDDRTTAVDGEVGSQWLSAEQAGRIVLGSPRATRPSVSLELTDGASEYDLAELGDLLVVHDRIDGTVVLIDAVTAQEVDRFEGPRPVDSRPVVLAAGDRWYAVDADRGRASVLVEGVMSEPTPFGTDLALWTATDDGLLWFVDVEGRLQSFDGERTVVQAERLDPADVRLTALGTDPVLYLVSAGRVRFPRRDSSFEVPGAAPGMPAAVAAPGTSAGCVTVLAGDRASCVGVDGVQRTRSLPVGTADGAVVGGDGRTVVVARPASADVVVASWQGGPVTTLPRSEPSERTPVVHLVAGAVVVDDPGSRHAFTVGDRGLVEMDKLSRRTVVLNATAGPTDDGVGVADEDADLAGVLGDAEGAEPAPDADGVNDPPEPRPDRAVTRVGRAISINVLGNDVDPDGDQLAIVALGAMPELDGEIDVIGATAVRYVPPDTSDNREVSFTYQVADPSGAVGQSVVTVEIIGDGSNRPPTAGNDAGATRVGAAATVRVLANDLDADGDPLTITRVDGARNGALAIDGSSVRYEPSPGFVGRDEFEYRVSDGFGGTASARVEVTVVDASAGNAPPVAVGDRVFVRAGVPFRIDPLLNDSDPDGDRITLVRTSTLPNVDLVTTGRSIEIVTDPALEGLLVLTYWIADEGGLEAAAEIAVYVEQTRRGEPPLAIDDRAASTGEPVSLDVVANDVDPSGGQLVVTTFTQPGAGTGTVTQVSPTTLRFSPARGVIGPARFTYTVSSADGLTDSAVVTIEVSPSSGSGPVANDDFVMIFQGQSAEIDALANDVHPEGLPLAYAAPPTTSVGQARVTGRRTIVFEPPNTDIAVYSIGYSVLDRLGRRASARITVQVVAAPTVNLFPVAADDVALAQPGSTIEIDVLRNDRDPDGTVVRLVEVGTPSRGGAAVVGELVRYSAPSDGGGVATFTYRVADANGAVASATVTVQVAERPRIAPVAQPDLLTIGVGQTATVLPLANDTDPDGTEAGLSIASLGPARPSGGATVSLSGRSVRVVAGPVPGTYESSYTVVDGDGLTATSSIVVVVQPPPNQPPVANNDVHSGQALPFSVPVMQNDFDPDGGRLSLVGIAGVSPATAGQASIEADRVVFIPNRGFAGTVSIGYTVRDEQDTIATAILTATLTACSTPPSIGTIASGTDGRTPVDVLVLSPADSQTRLEISVPPAVGTAVITGDGASVRYTPVASGTYTIGLTAITSCGERSTGRISMVVNNRPVARDDRLATTRDTPAVLSVLGNDADPDNDPITVADVSAGTNGVPELAGGVITFRPAAGFEGVARFTYRVRDALGAVSAPATVTVDVAAPNRPPRAIDDVVTVAANATVVVASVLANDQDDDLDPLTVVATSSLRPAGSATVTIAGAGTGLRLDITPGFGPGTITLAYTVSDGRATATALLTVNLVNQAPVAVDDAAVLDLAARPSVTVNVLANDSDPDGPPSGLQLLGLVAPVPAGATVVSGGIRYEPPSGVSGDVTIRYRIRDAFGAEASAVLVVSVVPVSTTTTTPTTTAPPVTDPPPAP